MSATHCNQLGGNFPCIAILVCLFLLLGWFPLTTQYLDRLPWRKCQYGGDDEYYVQVRETAMHQQEKVNSEQKEEIEKDTLRNHILKCPYFPRNFSLCSPDPPNAIPAIAAHDPFNLSRTMGLRSSLRQLVWRGLMRMWHGPGRWVVLLSLPHVRLVHVQSYSGNNMCLP